jgi:hypothetical protein
MNESRASPKVENDFTENVSNRNNLESISSFPTGKKHNSIANELDAINSPIG